MKAVAHPSSDATASTAAPDRLYRVPQAMTLLLLSRSVLYEQIRVGRLR